jgi:hypothetical protein
MHERGLRNVIDGEADLLVGFEFNIRGNWEPVCLQLGTIDRASGEISVDICP